MCCVCVGGGGGGCIVEIAAKKTRQCAKMEFYSRQNVLLY